MKWINLTKGQKTCVDDEDFEYLSQFKWFAIIKKSGGFYAARQSIKINGKQRTVLMHRVIMRLPLIREIEEVDHKNGDSLMNIKSNLRICTRTGNNRNRRQQAGSSRFKGVCWYKPRLKWVAKIGINAKKIHLGYFIEEKDAALAYNVAAVKLFGEFAKINHGITT